LYSSFKIKITNAQIALFFAMTMTHKFQYQGCGWPGFVPANPLVKKGFLVMGSPLLAEKISVLENERINAFQISN
jgi:hypothetical protein